MKIKNYIQKEIIQPRMAQSSVLVVYDADARYHEMCLELASDDTFVVDASQGSILSRELAIKKLQKIGQRGSNEKLSGRESTKTEWQPRDLTDAQLDNIVQLVKSGQHHQPATEVTS